MGFLCQDGGCVEEPPPVVTLGQVWSQIISPVCLSCHGPGEGGLVMGQTTTSFRTATVGQASSCGSQAYIVAGDADASYLVKKIEGQAGICGARMPFGGPYLSPTQINLIRDWIDAGALDN